MRSEDWEKFQLPYPSARERPERRLAGALDVAMPALTNLHDLIDGDLDTSLYGIGWWAPHPGTSRRILISDHLIQCIASIPSSLVEAKLHFLEALDFWERDNNFMARCVSVSAGRIETKLPPRLKPSDDMAPKMADLHVAGFFRSILTALDCLGASMVGVLALPVRLLKTDYSQAKAVLAKLERTSSRGGELQKDFHTKLNTLLLETGPIGWLEWTMASRHMLVHRARRLGFTQLRPQPTIFGADGRPVIRVDSIPHLSRDPDMSDVEALLLRNSKDLFFSEHAERTLKGVLTSTIKLIEGTARYLVDAWVKRRGDPSLLIQPKEQWPDIRSSPSCEFIGYAPGSSVVDPKTIITGPDVGKRLLSAALDDDHRTNWPLFD